MIINGVKLDIDFTDADILERIENGSKIIYEKAEELKENKDLSPADERSHFPNDMDLSVKS